ncbi:hypothetical protein LTS08_003090 [Lithohypha guttulata]|nr:hypothetical protein LTS08_003090 [Lithohypha guttulata]
MDQAQASQKSNIARPISRLPMARASSIPTSGQHDESAKRSRLPHITTSNSKKQVVRPLGESNHVPRQPSFGWTSRLANLISTTTTASPQNDVNSLDITPPNVKSDFAIIDEGNENAESAPDSKDDNRQPKKRQPRPLLSERTVETLSQISPAPSPTRRRSSTVKSSGSMGPPSRPASAMRNNRPTTPSTPSSGHPASPSKRPFRPPGKPTTPSKDAMTAPGPENIYTPPRAFVRDASSKIGRPRESRRSVSTAIVMSKEDKPRLRPTRQATKVKSLYDLRGTASRGVTSKPATGKLVDLPTTPDTMERKPSYGDISTHTGLMKARSPGENVIASKAAMSRSATKPAALAKKPTKRPTVPQEPWKEETALPITARSSATLRDTIAKAKAARREEMRRSQQGTEDVQAESSIHDVPAIPIIDMGRQSLRKKIQNAIATGTLNLSAMSLKSIPEDVLTMYDLQEDSPIAWSETVDLKKLMVADNEIENLSEIVFPDWSEEEMLEDSEKSNQFGGLEILDLHGNSLRSLPIGIRRLQQLRTLNLSSNNIDITVFSIIGELANLQELRLAKDGLHGDMPSLSFSLPSLQVLDLSDNQLDQLPSSISELRNLQRLFLGGNRLSSIQLESLPSESLIELDLSRNMLTSSFTGQGIHKFEKMQSLDISFNNIEYLCSNFFELPLLQTVGLHNNRIDTLPDMSGCANLTTITASNNALTSIPEGLYSLTKLRNIDLSSNNIRTIGSEIAAMENLSNFNIAGNPLREKKYLTMDVQDIRTSFARKSEAVDVTQMDVNKAVAPSNCNPSALDSATSTSTLRKPKAGTLDASSCGLSCLLPEDVDLASPIHTIRLANNDFTTLPVELLMHPSVRWSLKSLDMSHNPLLHSTDYISTEVHLPLLHSLYIVSTGLTTLDTLTSHLKAPELRELNISCHRLSGHIPWVRAWYPSITTLLASDNWFESIDVEAVRGLEVLDIRNNGIESLPPKIGLLGNVGGKREAGRLRVFECLGNKFRVPRLAVIEKGTEAVLKDLRRMVPSQDVPDEWAEHV